MLFGRSRKGRTIVLVGLVLFLAVGSYSQFAHMGSATDPTVEARISRMNFHMYSTIYMNSNSSIIIYNGADPNPPTYATAATGVVSCQVHQSAQLWFAETDVWLGGVSWITQPLPEDMVIQGNMSMTVWMSAPEQQTVASGYVFGLSEADGFGNLIGDPFYEYYWNFGSALAPSAASFTLTFNVNRTFTKGNILAFFLVAGSTTEGWQYQVYFDSASVNSFADLPILSVPVPEFSRAGPVATMMLVLLCSFVISRRRK